MLRDAQEHLVRLLTDASFRDACQRGVAAPDAVALCEGLPAAHLARYAEGLLRKRWRAVRGICPMSANAYPPLKHVYTAWLATHPAPAGDDLLGYGLTEALRALPALRRALADAPDAPFFLKDLLAFEVLRRCTNADRQPRFLRATCRVDQLAKALRQGQDVDAVKVAKDTIQLRFVPGRVMWKPLDPRADAPANR